MHIYVQSAAVALQKPYHLKVPTTVALEIFHLASSHKQQWDSSFPPPSQLQKTYKLKPKRMGLYTQAQRLRLHT